METLAIRPSQLDIRVLRCPIETPVETSFGVMRDRPAVLLRVAEASGAHGWGEVWCNFPTVGAEHRARLVRETVTPLLLGRDFASPAEASRHLERALGVLAIQCGEPGTIAQCIAGVDIALWDLVARRAGKPLYEMLGGVPVETIPVYASGINPDAPERLAEKMREGGHTAFKLKVGFGRERDLGNLTRLRDTLGDAARLMIDANQAWDVATAVEMARATEEYAPAWLEEPLRADAPREDWRRLRQAATTALAAGENMRGREFDAAIGEGVLGVIQPDVGKWGGLSGCLPVARGALAAGLRFCPHWLGGGIGLVASMHLLAAAGGDGMVEVDANHNPLREMMAMPYPSFAAGRMAMPNGPGLGVEPDLAALAEYERPI